MKHRTKPLKMVLAVLFLALTYILPFLTGQIPEIGAMLCPMHLSVLLCGYVCGWPWGLIAAILSAFFAGLTAILAAGIFLMVEERSYPEKPLSVLH